MEFSNSILPKEGSYYTLQDATISGGVLSISPGGSARYEIVETDIVHLTEYFRVALITNKLADRYDPGIKVKVSLRTFDDKYYNAEVYPTSSIDGVFTQVIQLQAGMYKSFVFEITSEQDVKITLWELCPEASDTDVEVIIEGVKQSLPRLLYDYNTVPIRVAQRESTIALIAYNLLDDTDLQGHLQVSYVASEACTLVIRFKDNGSTELFCPVTYDIKPGKGSIGIPHAYLHRLYGIHDLIVTAQVTSGELAIETRGLLFTIDGGYLAERIIDVGGQIYDLSVKQVAGAESPQELWIIGLEEEKTLVRKRPYTVNTSIAFEPLYELPKAISAAIEFDGEWFLREKAQNYTIHTEDWPWLFWVEPDGTLYTQLGQDTDTLQVLDTEVSYVSACRGYKSTMFAEQDQGLICTYIKQGVLYYRTYAYSADLDMVIWMPAVEVFSDAPVVHAHVHRLNDFRVAIAFSTEDTNYWYISDRTYVNQGVPPETISVAYKTQLWNMGIHLAEEEPVLEHEVSISDDGRTAIVTFNYDMVYSPEWGNAFTWVQNVQDSQVESIEVTGKQIIFHFNVPKTSSFKIGAKGMSLRYKVPNAGVYAIPDMTFFWEIKQYMSYSDSVVVRLNSSELHTVMRPILTLPARHEEAIQVQSANATLGIDVKPILTLKGCSTESIAITCNEAAVTIQVSQIGTDPI